MAPELSGVFFMLTFYKESKTLIPHIVGNQSRRSRSRSVPGALQAFFLRGFFRSGPDIFRSSFAHPRH